MTALNDKTKEGVREAYIAHDSAITDDSGNRVDMHGISEKFVRKGNSLATGAGSTCYILHKINKLFRAMNLSEKDLETLVREIDKNVMIYMLANSRVRRTCRTCVLRSLCR